MAQPRPPRLTLGFVGSRADAPSPPRPLAGSRPRAASVLPSVSSVAGLQEFLPRRTSALTPPPAERRGGRTDHPSFPPLPHPRPCPVAFQRLSLTEGLLARHEAAQVGRLSVPDTGLGALSCLGQSFKSAGPSPQGTHKPAPPTHRHLRNKCLCYMQLRFCGLM